MAILLGTLDSDTINGTASGDIITALSGNDRIIAGSGADLVDASVGDDIIYAAGVDNWRDGAVDTIIAGAGDDRVFAAYGDALSGGTGLDTLYLDLSGATAGVDADFRPEGFELGDILVEGPLLRIGNADVSGFEIVRQVIGSDFDDSIRTLNRNATGAILDGGAGNDLLQSGGGQDRLDGGSGADNMLGGGGNDTYTVDNVGDATREAEDRGFDQVFASVDYRLFANVEALTLTGNAITGRGNDLGNLLTGNAQNNVLVGLAGDDRIDGGAGNDRIVGGVGRDALSGGTGADQFVFVEGDTAATRPLADTITDFRSSDGDRIVLRGMDAVVGGEDDNFAFIGTDAFSGTAGELRVQKSGTDMFVSGDTNGDGIADFTLRVSDVASLVATDFVL